MSELINNREYRQKILKELIKELHEGKSVDYVKERFAKLIEGISPTEISDMEQSLIEEGMPVEEVQRLCDVHAAVFKGSIEDIHRSDKPEETPGHPLHTFKLENSEIKALIEEIYPLVESYKKSKDKSDAGMLLAKLNLLWDIDKHFLRKENLLFPYLQKYNITAPPKVMWGADDEIRDMLKNVRNSLKQNGAEPEELADRITRVLEQIKEMIFKEESILFPMAVDTLTEDEWISIAEESDDIGYCLAEPAAKWNAQRGREILNGTPLKETDALDFSKFETGMLKTEEINAMFNTMPVDITFIDKNDIVKYYTNGKHRLFARTRAVLGRDVRDCHPPASVHIVEKMLEDFKSGVKDHEDFYIKMGGTYAYIRYFALKGEDGDYLGTMEFSQDIAPIQNIKGEKRLMS